ncbi:hypothetical protein NAEGRDRAFT_68229 [Naegleria gruberi]|uniref:F-box domain-containing protein n=1 Tax=Naegleria gruberi TaxID=5762 RepID=D2VH02_NAEGR|nr:uncharacterized protein NAEGRDRAFT_68229 [Naegleria gruberi]EFC43804.1 hypothetical protein NAEGRDRAFT_68229 [Naegleria gruberi]|eukprot:XP_002676548.1 hypothetical protein NAEGRDRAFT_68229 [Naegleria gruberi strain NEG-M]
MSNFVDLPSELQIEIFSILSVKHLRNILSINKSIHEQLIQSETFWRTLIKNYSKVIGESAYGVEQASQELFEIENVKKQLIEMIEIKKRKTKQFQQMSMELEYMLRELEMVQREMNARNESTLLLGGNISDQFKNRIESLKQKGESVKKEKEEIAEKLKKTIID